MSLDVVIRDGSGQIIVPTTSKMEVEQVKVAIVRFGVQIAKRWGFSKILMDL